MVEPRDDIEGGGPSHSEDPSFSEGLAYLLAFSEALLDLIPEGIAILDGRLQVRNANRAFLDAFGATEVAGVPALPDTPFFRAPIPEMDGISLGNALLGILERDDALALDRFEASRTEDEAPADWRVRAESWDTEDPRYRRVLLWFQQLPTPAPAPEPDPDPDPGPDPGPDPAPDPPVARDALLQEREEELFALGSLADGLLALVPADVCVLDPALRVRRASRGFEARFGRRTPSGASGDRHVFALFPDLRDSDFLSLLEESRESDDNTRGILTVRGSGDTSVRFDIEVRPVPAPGEGPRDLLLLLHSTEGMAPMPELTPPIDTAVACSLDTILAPENLSRWPLPSGDRILVVEADAWSRMVLSDALRSAGYDDVVLTDSGAEDRARSDPASYGLIVVGFDGRLEDARAFCEDVTARAARVPVLAVTSADADNAVERTQGLRLVGVLPGALNRDALREVAKGILERTGPMAAADADADAADATADVAEDDAADVGTDAAADAAADVAADAEAETEMETETETEIEIEIETAADVAADAATEADVDADVTAQAAIETEEETEAVFEDESRSSAGAPLGLLLIGAAAEDIPLLRRLHESPELVVRMVFDPDPAAAGLSVARELGIPSLSGALTLHMERPPDAVLVARRALEVHLADLHMEEAARVTPDELELFLDDPGSFLEADRSTRTPSEPPPAAPDVENEPAMPEAWDAPEAPGKDEPESDLLIEHDFAPAFEAPRDPEIAPIEDSFPAPAPPPIASLPPASLPEPPPVPAPEPRPSYTKAPAAPHDTDFGTDDMRALLGALDLLLDFERFAEHVLQMAVRMTRGTSGSLMLIEESGEELRIAASSGLSDMVVQNTRQRIGEGIAGRVAEDGEPLLLVGRVGDERFRKGGERTEIRSSVCVPLVSDGQVVGVLNLNSDPELAPFDRDELHLVAGLGRQVGAALDRSRQLRRMRGRSFELSVRGEIESIVASDIEAGERLERVAGRLVQLLNADTCGLYFREPDSDSLVLGAIAGIDLRTRGTVSVPVGTGLVGWVAKNLRPLVLRSGGDPRHGSGEFHLTSVGVPIRYQTDLIGVMTIETSAATGVDDDRLRLIASVASVIGQHVGESREHRDSERRMTMLAALGELGVAFTAASEPRGLARLVSFSASTVLESDVASVRLRRPDATSAEDVEWFELLAVHGASEPTPGDPLAELEERIARDVVTTRTARSDADIPLEEIGPMLERSNVDAVLGIPMTSGRELLGIIIVYRVIDVPGKRAVFREQDMEIGERLGDYAAAAAVRFYETPGEEEDE